jgi:hypothetical protein
MTNKRCHECEHYKHPIKIRNYLDSDELLGWRTCRLGWTIMRTSVYSCNSELPDDIRSDELRGSVPGDWGKT